MEAPNTHEALYMELERIVKSDSMTIPFSLYQPKMGSAAVGGYDVRDLAEDDKAEGGRNAKDGIAEGMIALHVKTEKGDAMRKLIGASIEIVRCAMQDFIPGDAIDCPRYTVKVKKVRMPAMMPRIDPKSGSEAIIYIPIRIEYTLSWKLNP